MLAGSHSPSTSQNHRVSKITKKVEVPISMEVKTLAFENSILNSGVSCLPGKLNEDRYCIFNGEEHEHPEYYAFGVFDGHGGTFGSELCSQKFANNVLNVVNRKVKKFQKLTNLPILGDIADTFMCESIRKVTKSISREIKMRSITGSTCVALFIRKLDDGSCRVYCSNTGDSRCIVYRKKELNSSYSIMIMSEDHGLNLQRETDRIIQRKQVDWKPLPASDHTEIDTKDGWKMQKSYPSSIRMSRALALLTMLKASSSNEPESPRGSVTLEKDVVLEVENTAAAANDIMIQNISIDVIDIQAPVVSNNSSSNKCNDNVTIVDNASSPKRSSPTTTSSSLNNINIVHNCTASNSNLTDSSSLSNTTSTHTLFSPPKDAVAATTVTSTTSHVSTLSPSPLKPSFNGVGTNSSNKLYNSLGTTTASSSSSSSSSSAFDHILFESLVQKMLPSENDVDDDMSIDNQYSIHSPEEPLKNVPGRESSITELLEVTVHGIGSGAAGVEANAMLTNKVLNDIDSDNDNEVDDNLFITAPIVHKDSFIGRRTTKDGKYVGKKALFSRHDISITMTRSVGDRHAARSCVCTPEITAITIGSDEYARFILASDGFWDVIDDEQAIKLIRHITDPIKATTVLVWAARKAREVAHIRIDDITCLVVDINPECYAASRMNKSSSVLFTQQLLGDGVDTAAAACGCHLS